MDEFVVQRLPLGLCLHQGNHEQIWTRPHRACGMLKDSPCCSLVLLVCNIQQCLNVLEAAPCRVLRVHHAREAIQTDLK